MIAGCLVLYRFDCLIIVLGVGERVGEWLTSGWDIENTSWKVRAHGV